MHDLLYRFTFENFAVRGEIVALRASWRAIAEHRAYAAAERDYLGQAMAAASLLSGTIKFAGSLILQLQGQGPLRTLVAQATHRRTIRGMAHAEGKVPADDFAAALGEGRMVLTAEAPNGESYQGIVALEASSLAAVIERYFEQSEQLPTRVWLAADSQVAAGLFLQRLPGQGVNDEDWQRVCLLAETLSDEELLEVPPKVLLQRLFHEEDLRLYAGEPVAFRCNCSRDRVASTLRGLGQAEVEQIISERGSVEVDCEFCKAHYRFDAVDAVALFSDAPASDSPGAHH